MRSISIQLLSVVMIVLLLTACQAGQEPTKSQVGAVLGGVAGGVAGAQFGKGSGKTATTIAGVLLGVAAGSYIGSRMDAADRAEMNQVLETKPTGQTSAWKNPDTGAHYEVTPTKTIPSESAPCREFTTKVLIGGKEENAYGTACRQPDGAWKITSMDDQRKPEW